MSTPENLPQSGRQELIWCLETKTFHVEHFSIAASTAILRESANSEAGFRRSELRLSICATLPSATAPRAVPSRVNIGAVIASASREIPSPAWDLREQQVFRSADGATRGPRFFRQLNPPSARRRRQNVPRGTFLSLPTHLRTALHTAYSPPNQHLPPLLPSLAQLFLQKLSPRPAPSLPTAPTTF